MFASVRVFRVSPLSATRGCRGVSADILGVFLCRFCFVAIANLGDKDCTRIIATD